MRIVTIINSSFFFFISFCCTFIWYIPFSVFHLLIMLFLLITVASTLFIPVSIFFVFLFFDCQKFYFVFCILHAKFKKTECASSTRSLVWSAARTARSWSASRVCSDCRRSSRSRRCATPSRASTSSRWRKCRFANTPTAPLYVFLYRFLYSTCIYTNIHILLHIRY